MPLLCPLSIVSDTHKSIIHGAGEWFHFLSIVSKYFKGCILVFEYCYFLSQSNSGRNPLNIALKEYQQSGTQAIVSNALQGAIMKHSNDKHALSILITNIILNNQMCKLSNIPWTSDYLINDNMAHQQKNICEQWSLHYNILVHDVLVTICCPLIWNLSMILTVS